MVIYFFDFKSSELINVDDLTFWYMKSITLPYESFD
jgi:hypothetical protein